MKDLHDTREASEDKTHNTEDHDANVLPENPVPLAESMIPECHDFNDRREDESESAAADGTNEGNDSTKIRDHRGENESEQHETDTQQVITKDSVVLAVESRA